MTTTIIFPGQGSQKIGMCKDFYDSCNLVKCVFEEASESLGYSVQDLCFNENDKLNLTEYTQPALLTCEYAMWAYLRSRGLDANFYAGHSLGEYTALVAAGVLKFADAVKVVRKRGELMQNAVPLGQGSMRVISFEQGFDVREPRPCRSAACPTCKVLYKEKFDAGEERQSSVLEYIKERCNQVATEYNVCIDLANLNSPRQLVISGDVDALDWISGAIEGELYFGGVKTEFIKIPVSAPFHSKGMSVIEDEFEEFIKQFSFNYDNVSSVYSNKTGLLHTQKDFLKNLVSQISSPVDWIGNMESINSRSGEVIEIGPGKPLSGFFRSLNTNVTSVMIVRQADALLKSKGLSQ